MLWRQGIILVCLWYSKCLVLRTLSFPLLLRFLPLLKCRLVHPPIQIKYNFSIFLQVKLWRGGRSLGNIAERENWSSLLNLFLRDAGCSFVLGRVWEDIVYQVMKMCIIYTVYIIQQSSWPSKDHKLYSINIIFDPMLFLFLNVFLTAEK